MLLLEINKWSVHLMVSIETFKNVLDHSTVYLNLKQKSADKNKNVNLKKINPNKSWSKAILLL